MATFAVGDVHGNLPALREVLEHLRREAGSADTVVFLGDYIDRGPDAKGCVDALLRFRAESVAAVVCLMGNHEHWFLETLRDPRRHSWLLGMEGLDTIRSYSTEAAEILRAAVSGAGLELYGGDCVLPYDAFFDRLPADHVEFFEGLQDYFRTDDGVFSHAGLDPAVSGWERQDREAFLWGGDDFPHEYDGDDVVVYGHHNNYVLDDSGWPLPSILGRTIGIDTISQGVLTAIRLPDRALFQSARHRMPKSAA